MPNTWFRFKQFTIRQEQCAMKVSTDGVLLGAWADLTDASHILDIGTGTGLLALIAAQRNGAAQIDAVEIDARSAMQAAENISKGPWKERIRVHALDVRQMDLRRTYDHVICNPPFYAGEMEGPDQRKRTAKHGAELTFTELMRTIDRSCAPEGRCSLVVPANREAEFLREALQVGLHPQRRAAVRYVADQPVKRVMLELARTSSGVAEEELVVESGPSAASLRYRELLRDLMLNH